ncbi:hypothetical protein XH99_02575 [Bradyrhizobium nanningense]|uniref:Uncharacterized protein n=1 Tax=Bradyrhizobium nanningense TaxID=1325118 RepID=A0A4Q0SER9_9BRAD|nr:hypothetical protein XH99_02575 [Bradyrhizobium nanningense]
MLKSICSWTVVQIEGAAEARRWNRPPSMGRALCVHPEKQHDGRNQKKADGTLAHAMYGSVAKSVI